ncbi:DUF397 domain-containing protein [Nocardia sp. NPDC004340]|uniref:DUF397 domain-containing protein n=1 Tax=Nocardia sp. CA-136227 TaxID=3239979 RepID=UPI003D95616F
MNVELHRGQWFKSSHSSGGGECVEVAFFASGKVGVRDSKNPTGPVLTFAPDEWDTFTAGISGGSFSRP